MERRTLDSCGKQRRFRPRSACRRPLKNCNIIIIVGGRLLNSRISFVFRGDSSLSMGRAPSRFVTAFLQGLGLSRNSHRSRAVASPNQLNIRFQINKFLFNLEILFFFSALRKSKRSLSLCVFRLLIIST